MTMRLTASVLILCRLCALVASSSPSPSPSPSTTTTVTTTDGGGWPWWAWFLVTVLPCCILLLCCAAGGAIPFLRKKKPVAGPAQVYETRPFVRTTASALGDCGRSFRDSGTASDDNASHDCRARCHHQPSASHDVHRTICDDSRASRVLRWAPPCCVKALKVCWTLILGFDDTCRGSARKRRSIPGTPAHIKPRKSTAATSSCT